MGDKTEESSEMRVVVPALLLCLWTDGSTSSQASVDQISVSKQIV